MSYRLSKEELDEQFEQFLKESVLDDSFELVSSRNASDVDDNGESKKNEANKKEAKPWWMTDDDGGRGGLTGAGRSFMKYSKASQPIAEVDEEEQGEKTPFERGGNVSVSMSKDSLEVEDSVLAAGPAQSCSGFGMDTLEEQEEKERFFADLEKGASSTIDYSKLNKELDLSDSAPLRVLIGNMGKKQSGETMQSTEDIRNKGTPASLEYSEDFEEVGETSFDTKDKETRTEGEVKTAPAADVHNQGEEKTSTSMLAKVLLLDSVESTGETQKMVAENDSSEDEKKLERTANDMTGTGISYGQTNSDLEALYQAYHHIDQSLEDTGSRKKSISGKTDSAKYFDEDGAHSSVDGPCNVSAVESDLPTIEELMKHVEGESAFPRGFDLRPVSEIEVAVEKPPEISDELEHREHLRISISEQEKEDHHPESHKKDEALAPQINAEGKSVTVNKGIFHKQDDLMKRRNSDRWRDELFGEFAVTPESAGNFKNFEHSSHFWDDNPNDNKVPDLPAVHRKAQSPQSKTRKPQTSHYASVKSSGYGKVSPPAKRPLSGTSKDSIKKMASKNRSPQDQGKNKYKAKLSGGRTVTFDKSEPHVNSSGHLLQSVQLYSSYREEQLTAIKETSQLQVGKTQLPDSSTEIPVGQAAFLLPSGNLQSEHSLLEWVHTVEDRWRKEHNLAENLKAELFAKEKELHRQEDMKLQYEKDLDQLKKENYLLQIKLHSLEEANQKNLVSGKTTEPVTQEKLLEIEREIREQETLIHGYHQENEKLYHQVKELQAKNKQIEENAFRENQRLMTEVATLKEQIDKSNLQQPGPKDNEQARNLNFTELLSELRAKQKEEARFMEEIRRLKQEKQSLEVDLEQMKKQRDVAKAQAVYTSGDKAFEMKILEETYKEEVSRLNKRLQWYAENQELLDKDATRLKAATAETEKLKELVDKLQAEVGNRTLQQQKRVKDRAADAKRIQDLERQVKEMEEIIRRRHPNSLPALIYAAASVPVTNGEVSSKLSSVTFLEKRVKKLESELEGKDEEAKKGLRALEQQYQKVKIQYENRIAELEQLLSHKHLSAAEKPCENTEAVKACEQEKRQLIETNQTTVANLQWEIQQLRDLLAQAELKTMEKECLSFKKADVEHTRVNTRIDKLNQELIIKKKEVQELTRTVERLQKERRALLSEQRSPRDKLDTRHKLSKKVGKDDVAVNSKVEFKDKEPFPSTLDEKLYQPAVFAGSHISEVLQENEKLKSELRQLSLEADQQRIQLQAAVAKTEQDARRARENAAEHASALKAAHQRELETILTQHALEHSSSQVAELTSKVSTQEIVIKHLREQVTELQKEQEALAVTKVQQETLQSQMIKLLEDLREAKERHSPEMKHFLALEKKIQNMELKHSQREQELQQIIYQTQQRTGAEWTQEVEKWKLLAQKRNQELETFRMELDSILDVLRELQRQGVVIPVPASARTNTARFSWNT